MREMLLNNDCLVAMDNLEDNSIDLVVCDLPYGVTKAKHDKVIPLNKYIKVSKKLKNGKIKEVLMYEDDYLLYKYKEGVSYEKARKTFLKDCKEGLWDKYNRVVKNNGAIILFGQDKFTVDLIVSNRKNHRYNLIWEKLGQPTGFLNANKMPLRSHEDILVFYNKLPEYFPQKVKGKMNHAKGNSNKGTNNNYSDFNQEDNRELLGDMKHPKSILKFKKPHPPIFATQKSVELCEWLIKSYSKEGDTVLDNSMGSGTTGIACKRLNRNFIGIELNEDNFNLAKNRLRGYKDADR